ncbi:MAG: fused MFS/spermidine synthase [Thermoanaerobaculia bacterium]
MSHGPSATPSKRRLLLFLFTLSGACGLVYEIVWMRRLALVFGSTTLAVSTVLASFMGGLALGSWWIGRRADRRPEKALRLYALLEIAIGAIALAIPLLFRGVAAMYLSLAPALEQTPRLFLIVQFLLLAPVIVVPTMLMGGTLPLLARYLIHRLPELAGRIGALYAANTLGAAAGVTAATYFLLPAYGISSTELLAALSNVAVGGRRVAAGARLRRGSARGSAAGDAGPLPPAGERPGAVAGPRAGGVDRALHRHRALRVLRDGL